MIFFFNDPAPTEIYTLPLPAALPISERDVGPLAPPQQPRRRAHPELRRPRREGRLAAEVVELDQHRQRRLLRRDRKSTRLNSSHANISYAVFCLKKKKNYHS